MALDLNDQKAIDYSSDVPYFPFNTYGHFDFAVLSFEESGPAGSEQNKSDKEFDIATVEVLASDNPTLKAGDVVIFWFQTGGDGINLKNRANKAAELRVFVAAACGVDPKSAAYKKYDAKAGRTELLARDFEANECGVRLHATPGNETKPSKAARATNPETPALYFTEKGWAPLAG